MLLTGYCLTLCCGNFNFQYLLPRPSGYIRPSQRRDSVCTTTHLRYNYCLCTCRRLHIYMCDRAHSYICVTCRWRPHARRIRHVVVVVPILGLVTGLPSLPVFHVDYPFLPLLPVYPFFNISTGFGNFDFKFFLYLPANTGEIRKKTQTFYESKHYIYTKQQSLLWWPFYGSDFIVDDDDQSTRLQLVLHLFGGPRRLGETKGYANQILVVRKVCSSASSVNSYGHWAKN